MYVYLFDSMYYYRVVNLLPVLFASQDFVGVSDFGELEPVTNQSRTVRQVSVVTIDSGMREVGARM